MERRLTAIFAADAVGYSRLMQADEIGTLATLKYHYRDLLDGKIAEHRGRIVKLLGDGILAEFSSVVNAVACAAEIQREMLQRNADVPADRRIEFRIGIHLGDVIVEDGDIFGEGVNIAARIEGFALPGGVAVSAAVRDNVGHRLAITFEDAGERTLKNIDRPVRIYNLVLDISDRNAERPPEVQSAKKKPSIAVLPFDNISGDPEQEYFADGMTEDIITDLSKVSGLNVIARNSVFAYKGKSIDVQEVSRRFNVTNVLEGSVRKSGQRVRITAQLIDGNHGTHVWAERYDRELTDVFTIQDEITHAIVDQLRVKLLPEEKAAIEQAPTESVEAYTYYLRGRQSAQIWTKPNLLFARRMFEKAVDIDPRYSRAYAGIADCDSALYAWHDTDVSIDTILAMSDRALAIDPNLAEAHASRGLALHISGRPGDAFAEFETALALDPNLYETHVFYARLLFTQGRLEEAARHFERASEIREDDYRSLAVLTNIYRSLGRKADRESAARRGIRRAELVFDLSPDNAGSAVCVAVGLANIGEKQRAETWVARALAVAPDDPHVLYNLACAYALIGNADAATELIEKVVVKGTPEQMLWLERDSDLDSIRNLPRFLALMSKLAGHQRKS